MDRLLDIHRDIAYSIIGSFKTWKSGMEQNELVTIMLTSWIVSNIMTLMIIIYLYL